MCPLPVAKTSESFAKLSYSEIDNALTNLLRAGLQDFFQVLNISFFKCDDDGKQAVGVLPRSSSPLGTNMGYSADNFLIPQILAHKDAKTQLLWTMSWRTILLYLLRQR